MEEMQPFSDRPIGPWMTADEMSLLPQSTVTAGWVLLTEQKEAQFQKHKHKSQQGITGLSLEIHTIFFFFYNSHKLSHTAGDTGVKVLKIWL